MEQNSVNSTLNKFKLLSNIGKFLYVILAIMLIYGFFYSVNWIFKSPPAMIIGSSCTLDSPRPEQKINLAAGFIFNGWAFDKELKESPKDVSATFVSTDKKNYYTFSLNRVQRPDVVNFFKIDEAINSGFSKSIAPDKILPGEYDIYITQRTSNGLITLCSLGKHLF
jgi:hypothetical protein